MALFLLWCPLFSFVWCPLPCFLLFCSHWPCSGRPRAGFFYSRSVYITYCSCINDQVQYCTRSVCVFSPHSFWTSSSLDVPAGVTQEEGHTGFLIRLLSAVRALIFLARRIQPFLCLVDREVEFCVLTI